MKFEQKKESDITFVGYDVRRHVFPNPEVGKIYKAFDDGKIRRSRLDYWKITKAINLDSDKISKNVLKMLADEIYTCHWLYAPEQRIIYRAKAVDAEGNYDKDVGYCYFLITKAGEWFGAGCGWWSAVLDTDDYYYNMMLKQEAEDERMDKFHEEAMDVLAAVFPKIREATWCGDFLKDLSAKDYDLAKKTLEDRYNVTLTKKQCKNLAQYRFMLIDKIYYALYPTALDEENDDE